MSDHGGTGPLVLEFVGLPGAGKSTISHALLARFTATGYDGIVTVGARTISCRGHLVPPTRGAAIIGRSAREARFLARRRRLVRAVVRYGAAVRPPSVQRLGFLWSILDYAFQISEHQGRDADVVVLDQASLQATWSVAVHGSRPHPGCVHALLGELRHSAGESWAVVHFDVDPETALRRIADRPTNTSRFDHMAPDEARALLPGLQRHLEVMMDRLRADGVPCLRLDTRHSTGTTCDTLMRFLHDLSPPRSLAGEAHVQRATSDDEPGHGPVGARPFAPGGMQGRT